MFTKLSAAILHDSVASSGRNRTNPRLIFIIVVDVAKRILQGFCWHELSHRFREHALTRPRVTDHQHVSTLFGSLSDDDCRVFLTNHLIDQIIGDGDICCGIKRDTLEPFIYGDIDNGIIRTFCNRAHAKTGLLRWFRFKFVDDSHLFGDLFIHLLIRHGDRSSIALVLGYVLECAVSRLQTPKGLRPLGRAVFIRRRIHILNQTRKAIHSAAHPGRHLACRVEFFGTGT